MRVPREIKMGLRVRIWKLRKAGVSCSRCSAAAKNGKTFVRGCGSQSSEWNVKSFMGIEAGEKLSTEVTWNREKERADSEVGPYKCISRDNWGSNFLHRGCRPTLRLRSG